MRIIRKTFLTGLIILLPSIVTVYILNLTFRTVDALLGNLLRLYIGHTVPGLGFLATVALIFFVGLLATNVIGHRLVKMLESWFVKIPLVRTIYLAVRQIIDAFSLQRSNVFESVVMIEYPRKGIYGVGFVTGKAIAEVQEKTSREMVPVFVPTSPNPTTGFLLLVSREELVTLSMTVEEALKLIISAGVVTPEWPRKNGR
ncbi:MAG: DUF502 domain-containing protein [Firmicutes bacterium]|nr:DUF502 domain-containing protein [Bacillota bacterium]